MSEITAHPVAWQLAYAVLDSCKPGGMAAMGTVLDTVDAIAEKVHPNIAWPNPWARLLPEQVEIINKKAEEAGVPKLDPEARVGIVLKEKQVAELVKHLKAYSENAPAAHGKALRHMLAALGEKLE
jgi:hypothetical protein